MASTSKAMPLIQKNQDLRADFGKRLRTLRLQKEMSQKELASKLGLQPAQLNKYESGLNAPPLEKIIELAEIFDVTVDFLVTGDQAAPRPLHHLRLWDRFRAVQELTHEDQESVIKVLDALIAQSQAALHVRERAQGERRARRR